MPLEAGAIDAALSTRLRTLDLAAACAPAVIRDPEAVRACMAGLWLLANDLDRSHKISQELGTPEGSLWHGIMHRREGDYANAKYWFRRAGRHPVYGQIAPDWDAMAFVDQVEACVTRGVGDRQELVRWQQREWECLFEHCWKLAWSE
jgi:hypothetical protein